MILANFYLSYWSRGSQQISVLWLASDKVKMMLHN